MKISHEQIDNLIQNCKWDWFGISISKPITEETEVAVEESVTESTEETISEDVVEPETHSCPLCESKLDSPVSDEKLTEHLSDIIDILNEEDSDND